MMRARMYKTVKLQEKRMQQFGKATFASWHRSNQEQQLGLVLATLLEGQFRSVGFFLK